MVENTVTIILFLGTLIAASSLFSTYIKYRIEEDWTNNLITSIIGLLLILSSVLEIKTGFSNYYLWFAIIIALLTSITTLGAFKESYDWSNG